MNPEIKILKEKKLIGKRIKMALIDDKTSELWKSFMPSRKEIKNNIGSELYSMQVYNPLYFNNFNPRAEFEKWAAIEVTDFNTVPDTMKTFVLKGGLYAVFIYNGSSIDTEIFKNIFGTWLPNSNYILDDRPHFEILGEKYKNEASSSEEEIWIPIKLKE
jgi:AraC family transcriptional regulator